MSPSSELTPETPAPASTARAASRDMIEHQLSLNTYLRPEPDSRAWNGSPRWAAILGILLTVCIALPTIPFWVARYLIFRPKGFNGLWGYLLCRAMTVMLATNPVAPPVETEEKRSRFRQILPLYGVDKLVPVTHVRIPALEHNPTNCAIPPGILSISLPGYILSPAGARAKGTERALPREKVILYFHGGGYVDGHPLSLSFAYKIARDMQIRLFAPTYRKVLSVDTAFPAPLLDAHAAWAYLLNMGFEPSDILMLGDSAGGHLCLYLAQDLVVSGSKKATGLPGGIALCSPWVDLTLSFPSWSFPSRDFLVSYRVSVAAKSALRYYTPLAAFSAPLSPVFAPEGYWRPFADIPMFVSWGQDEALLGEDLQFVAALKRDGVKVDTYEEPHGLHVGPIVPWSKASTYEAFSRGVKGVLEAM